MVEETRSVEKSTLTDKDIDIDDGPYGKRLILQAPWSERIRNAIHEHHIEHLEIRNPWHFPSRDLSFLCEFPFLKALAVIHSEIDIRPLQCLHELRRLEVVTIDKNRIDFRNFPSLESLSVAWSQSTKQLAQLRKLKKLFIDHPPKWVIPHIGEMTDLEDLALLSCSAEDLSPLGNLTKLKKLRITLFRRNTDNTFVSKLVDLEEYRVQDSRGFISFEPLMNLYNLRLISISESGPYDSLEPLRNLSHLEHVHIGGEVLDGDYSPVEDLPGLQRYYRRWR